MTAATGHYIDVEVLQDNLDRSDDIMSCRSCKRVVGAGRQIDVGPGQAREDLSVAPGAPDHMVRTFRCACGAVLFQVGILRSDHESADPRVAGPRR